MCRVLRLQLKVIALAVLSLLPLLPLHVQATTQKVLVLHSYHQGLEWSDSISAGVKSVFDPVDNIEVYYDYLDLKRNANPIYQKQLIALFRAKRQLGTFDLVLAADNYALEFIHKYGDELYPGVPIVFCGINFFHDNMITGMKKVTGVVEKADILGTFELMLRIHPNTQKIFVVLDNTKTGQAVRQEVEQAEKALRARVQVEYFTDFTWDSLRKDLASLRSGDLIYLLTINRDQSGVFASYLDGMKIVSDVAKVPVYGSWDFYLGKGIVGGIIVSGFEQGKQAADIALNVLNGQTIETIPIVRETPHKIVFDYQQLEKLGIKPEKLPARSEFINKPDSLLTLIQATPSWLLVCISLLIMGLSFGLIALNIRQGIIIKTNLQLSKMAITDALTGIYNRRHIMNRLSSAYQEAIRYNTPLSLVMLDIDHFKKLNDNHGHQFGDAVLRKIAAIIKHTIRGGDIFGRYGGEEFLLILPHTNDREARVLAERIRKVVEDHRWGEQQLQITISGGIIQYCAHTESELIKAADECLYQAKAEGRNQIC